MSYIGLLPIYSCLIIVESLELRRSVKRVLRHGYQRVSHSIAAIIRTTLGHAVFAACEIRSTRIYVTR